MTPKFVLSENDKKDLKSYKLFYLQIINRHVGILMKVYVIY